MEEKVTVKILPNGPIFITGELKIVHRDGHEEERKNVALCRCGHSNNKPFCDGAHGKNGFKDE
jgi:CDGSH-type Zn-finger protein